ncbi:hypothetical protein ALQ69_00710 [Pseudomonas savastanoi pv. glycinea]|nr:hypothetical protein ALQ69_00710 [Pseudomonas savastanoi pv. glycinea]
MIDSRGGGVLLPRNSSDARPNTLIEKIKFRGLHIKNNAGFIGFTPGTFVPYTVDSFIKGHHVPNRTDVPCR